MTFTVNQPKPFDVAKIRRDFPILSTKTSHGHPLIYLDNGATTQKPKIVIDRLTHYYQSENANIHRGVYELSEHATREHTQARSIIAKFIHARAAHELIFTSGTTGSINLVASSFCRAFCKPGDEIAVSGMEHHSNIVPWQIAAQEFGGVVRKIPISDSGELKLDELKNILSSGRVKLVAITHLSNSLGTINDVKQIGMMAHEAGARILVDGAQWVAHFPTNVVDLDCDFYAFSGHKIFGPTGIGVLYGKADLLEAMPPYQGGGDMIESVSFDGTTYAPPPSKFEAGTPNIAGAIGLGAAIDYVQSIGFDTIHEYEQELFDYATRQIESVPGLRIIGTAQSKASVISFVFDQPRISSLDLGMKLDARGIAVRTGHHCCQPVMDHFAIGSTTRASFTFYNTREDVDALVRGLKAIRDEAIARSANGASSSPSRPIAAPAQSVPAAKAQASGDTVVQFATAAGASPDAIANELAEVFEFLDDAQQRTQHLLDSADELPAQFEVLSKLTQRLPGCMSQVFILTRPLLADSTRLEIAADADAHIVRGEIVLLEKLFSGQRASDILAFDLQAFFARIGLEKLLTNQRRTGLSSMVQRIRTAAGAVVERQL